MEAKREYQPWLDKKILRNKKQHFDKFELDDLALVPLDQYVRPPGNQCDHMWQKFATITKKLYITNLWTHFGKKTTIGQILIAVNGQILRK